MSDRADCSQCLFALYKDEGYSVYTVLGTDIHCRRGLRKPRSAERFESFPVECNTFEEGKPQHYDVESKLPYSPPNYDTVMDYEEPNSDKINSEDAEVSSEEEYSESNNDGSYFS